MLKALEIVGFKSFADKTRFDFPPGITVVVGPNGSGKSNVVDAIKWVLGEQSAKSLRGKDMSDVIFKGSGTDKGRRAANTAEATIVLDNSDRRLENDADEVHVTRRVFRSGEGEYLINGEVCRLKDIKDLFRGTGIGTDAYSLIEQGKVDRLLQASTKERRAIFEEAAGISRFKAKKVEAQRRLARVDQNLLRLSDIVDEVGSRYRSVKAQASKAARYKEFSDRLRQLRIELSVIDWQTTTQQREQLSAEEQELADKLQASEEELRTVEVELEELQQQINEFSDTLLDLEGQASQSREKISKLENTIESETRRQREIEERQQLVLAQIEELRERLQGLHEKLKVVRENRTAAAETITAKSKKLAELQAGIAEGQQQLDDARQQDQELAEQQQACEKKWADQQRRSFEIETEVNSFRKSFEQAQDSLDQVTGEIQNIAVELTDVETAEKKLEDETAAKDDALAQAREWLHNVRQQLDTSSQELQELKSEKSGTQQRAKVIEELEKRLEGVQSGAKNILDRAKSDHPGPFREVRGLVADLIQVQVQHAALVDGILGEWSQFVVCDGPLVSSWLDSESPDIAGRVGIFRIDQIPSPSAAYDVDLSGLPSVIGRADQVVTVDPAHQPLIDYLLGNVWIVQSLADAFRLSREKSSEVRYVTLKGEILEPDGSLLLGPPSTQMSLISRRSELRSLKKKLIGLDDQLQTVGQNVQELNRQSKAAEQKAESLLHEHTLVSRQLSQHQLKREGLQKQVADLRQERDEVKNTLADFSKRKTEGEQQLEKLSVEMKQADDRLQRLVAERAELVDRQSQIEQLLATRQQEANDAKLVLAAEEKKLEGLDETLQQTELSRDETRNRLEQTETETRTNQNRLDESKRLIQQAEEAMATETAQRDELTRRIQSHSDERKRIVSRRDELQHSSTELTANTRQWQNRRHKIELDLGQIRNQQESLEERLRDDYGLELRELSPENIEFVIEDRSEAEAEVDSLRKKITSIGAVNTDALAELEDLEGRYLSLESQYQDLVQAKESLERIIVRINSDSRRIFVETLQAIRGKLPNALSSEFRRRQSRYCVGGRSRRTGGGDRYYRDASGESRIQQLVVERW
jgi:chromosome segregation protein